MSRELNVGLKGFMMDLVGERNRVQKEFDSVIHEFCVLAFDKAVKQFKESPYSTVYLISISDNEFKEYAAMRHLLTFQYDGVEKALEEATANLGLKITIEVTDFGTIYIKFKFNK